MPIPDGSNVCAFDVPPRAPEPGHHNALEGLPGTLAGLSGWRRALTASLLGAVLALSLPPVYALPAALIGFCGLAWLLNGARSYLRAWFDGWFFGMGFSAAAFYWIANALLVDAGRFGWLYPIALIAIAAGFGLFPALAALIARAAPAGAPRVVALGLAWLVAEWLRSWVLTGFPWNMVGTAFTLSDALIQPAAWGGPWLLSALLLCAALVPAIMARNGTLTRARGLTGLGFAVTLIATVWGLGALRLQAHPTLLLDDVVIRLVQPAIAQEDKWQSTLFQSHFATQIALTLSQPASEEPDLVIWPEAAVPYSLLRDPTTLAQLAAAAPSQGYLLTGAVRADRDENGPLRPWNSLLAIGRDGLVETYDKHHLVPFGEYVPLRGILPIDKITPGATDFAAGSGPTVMALGNLPTFGPLVCYEVIFSDEIIGDDGRPQWLLNITNDGWYGQSSGPYQHFQAARLRAVEQGLPMVRVANTGISGVIDGAGRVLASLPLEHRGVLDTTLPAALVAPTYFSMWGDWTFLGVLLAGMAGMAWTLLRHHLVGDGGVGSATGRR